MIESPETDLAALAASRKSFVKVDKQTVLAATDGVDHPAAVRLRQGAVEGSGTYPYFVTAPMTIAAALPHLTLAEEHAEPPIQPPVEPQKATVPASQPPVAPATKTPQAPAQPAPTKPAEQTEKPKE